MVGVFLLWWWVDPCRGGQGMWLRVPVLEPIGMRQERGIQGGLSGDEHGVGVAVVHAVRRHVADARVPVHRVVPREEGLAVRARILDAAEARREVRAIFHRLELRLRVRVVI